MQAVGSPQAVVLLLLAAGAWAATAPRAVDMGAEGGTMGMTLAAFLGMWLLMMSAMMLPAIAPVTSLYVRTFRTSPWRRSAQLVAGYLTVWALAGVPLFALAELTGRIEPGAAWPRIVAAGLFAAAGAWQLSGAKDRCLRHCRSPIGLLLHYGNFKGVAVDVRVGMHHGLWCLGCCWALMVLFVAFGVMNLLAMVALAALVYAEKRTAAGERLARVAGGVLIVLAVAVLAVPGIAPGLTGSDGMGGMQMGTDDAPADDAPMQPSGQMPMGT
jgi:predicted metal-binding membrane protein